MAISLGILTQDFQLPTHFLILFQDFQGTWGAPDSTSWPGEVFRRPPGSPGTAAERPVVRCLFFSVRQRPTLVGGWAVKNVLAMSGNGYSTGWYLYTQQLLFKRRNIVMKQRIIIRVPDIKQTRMIPDHSLGKQREKQLETTNQSSLQECVCNRVHYAQYASCRYFQKDTEVLAVQTHSCDRMSFILNQQRKINTGCEQLRPCHFSTPLTWKGEWDKPICQTASLWPWMSK